MKIRIITLLLHFFLFQVTMGQVEDIISNKTSDDILNEINNTDPSNVDEIISLSNILYNLAYKSEDHSNMITALIYLSSSNLRKGNGKVAIDYLDSALLIAKEYEEADRYLRVLNYKGNHYFDLEEYDKSASVYQQVLELAKKENLKESVIVANANLALVKLRAGDPLNALEDLRLSKRLVAESFKDNPIGVKYNHALLNARMSEAFIMTNQLDSALIYNDKGMAIAEEINLKNVKIDLLMHRGLLYKEKGNPDKALDFFYEAKQLSEDTNDVVFLGKILNFIGDNILYKQQQKDAIEVLTEAEQILSANYPNSDELSNSYKLLAQAYKEIDNPEKSNSYYELYAESLDRKSKKKSLASRKLQDVVISKYKNEITDLESQTEKQEGQLAMSHIIIISSIGALVVLLILFQMYNYKNKKRFKELILKVEQSNFDEEKNEILVGYDNTKNTELDINEDLQHQILNGLKKLEANEYYLKQECNLHNVSKKINTNTTYVSKVINHFYNKNFNTYINDLRIQYAIVRLKEDSKFRSYSIKSIAEEVGYKSADSFTKYFKQHTGLLPSFYIKRLKTTAFQTS